MAKIIESTEHIETREKGGRAHAFLIGTRIRVAHIYSMHIHNGHPVEWIINYYSHLEPAQIHAALAFSFDNPERIEREWQEILEDAEQDWQESDQMTLEKVKARIQERQQDDPHA